jgi:hypothetical protein
LKQTMQSLCYEYLTFICSQCSHWYGHKKLHLFFNHKSVQNVISVSRRTFCAWSLPWIFFCSGCIFCTVSPSLPLPPPSHFTHPPPTTQLTPPSAPSLHTFPPITHPSSPTHHLHSQHKGFFL